MLAFLTLLHRQVSEALCIQVVAVCICDSVCSFSLFRCLETAGMLARSLQSGVNLRSVDTGQRRLACTLLAGLPQCGGPAIVMVCVVRLSICSSVCQMQQQQQPLNGRCSGTARVGRYQKKHSAFCLSIGLCCVQAGFPHLLSSGFLWSRGR